MITETHERGNIMEFVSTPFSPGGTIVTPATMVVTINYPKRSGGREEIEVSMSVGVGGVWTAAWDTSGDDVGTGQVDYAVRSTGPSGIDQGQFKLKANRAS